MECKNHIIIPLPLHPNLNMCLTLHIQSRFRFLNLDLQNTRIHFHTLPRSPNALTRLHVRCTPHQKANCSPRTILVPNPHPFSLGTSDSTLVSKQFFHGTGLIFMIREDLSGMTLFFCCSIVYRVNNEM